MLMTREHKRVSAEAEQERLHTEIELSRDPTGGQDRQEETRGLEREEKILGMKLRAYKMCLKELTAANQMPHLHAYLYDFIDRDYKLLEISEKFLLKK